MFDVLAIGDVFIDHFFFFKDASVQCSVDRSQCLLCLNYADKIAVQKYVHSVAGNAANAAVATRRLGLKTALATVVGEDSGGREILHKMKKEGVDTRSVHCHPRERTNIASVLSFQGERTIMLYHAPRRWDGARLVPSRWIYFTSIGPRTASFRHLHDRLWDHLGKHPQTRLAMNPGTYQLQAGLPLLRKWLRRCEYLFVNKQEAEQIVSNGAAREVTDSLKQLRRLGVVRPVITDGANGSWGMDRNGTIYHCPIMPAKDVERTGAGDSFAASVVAATIAEVPFPESLRWGSANSASVVSTIGPQQGLLRRKEILSRLQRYHRVTATIIP